MSVLTMLILAVGYPILQKSLKDYNPSSGVSATYANADREVYEGFIDYPKSSDYLRDSDLKPWGIRDEETIHRLNDALDKNDMETSMSIMSNENLFVYLRNGERVLVLYTVHGNTKGSGVSRVMMLTGIHKEKPFWVPTYFISRANNTGKQS